MDAMEAVLRNFKLIPCPEGDSCTKPGCQWQHTWDTKPSSAAPEGDGEQDEDGPRKRRKVALEPGPPSSQSQPANPEPASTKRPVSPPPLKRKTPQPTNQPAPVTTPAKPTASRSVPKYSSPARSDQAVTPQKATQRQHTPQNVTPRKPETLNPRHLKSAAPAAHDFRYKALKLLHDQFQRLNNELKKDAKDDEEKLILSSQELIWLALDEEQRMATDKPPIYQNVIKNRIMTYKRMTPGQWKDERLAEHKKKTAPKNTPKESVLGPPIVIETGLTRQQEVDFLTHLYTPIDNLSQHGYVPKPPTDEEIAKAREGEEAGLGWEVCDRCTTRFQVFPGRREEDGALASGGQCVHHPGRVYYPDRVPGVLGAPTRRYRCCQQEVGEPGCATAETHVFKTTSPARLASVVPFVRTPPNPGAPTDRAVCFDCEMGYTVRGMELIRLTATSWPDGETLLDVLVQPVGEILDLNSRYSGVWPEDILKAKPWTADTPPPITSQPQPHEKPPAADAAPKTTTTEASPSQQQQQPPQQPPSQPPVKRTNKDLYIVPSPTRARTLLFSLLAPSTPLIGHGLENDLNAVRAVHPTLVDTVLLFPHRRGLPMRHGLRMLAETRLNKVIQADVAGGHDSGEDARAAGDLVRLVVQERWEALRGRGWRVDGGRVVPPGSEKGQEKWDGEKEGVLSEAFIEGGQGGEGEVRELASAVG